MKIRKAVRGDAEEICRIYNHYVLNTTVSFETEAVSSEEMQGRIEIVTEKYPWLVCDTGEKLLGYAYATKWKERKAYSSTAECAVYVDKDHHGKGTGSLLYGRLIEQCRTAGLHLLIAGISLPNNASIALHEKLGFSYIGKFSEVGLKFGKYADVGYWTLAI